MGKIDAEYWDSWVPVGSGLGSFTNLFGMNGAVTGCVRMSDCTMNSRLYWRLFRCRSLSVPVVGLPILIGNLWLLFSEGTGGEGK